MIRAAALLALAGLVPLVATPARSGVLTAATWFQTDLNTGFGPPSIAFPLTRTANDTRWSYSGTSTSTSISVFLNYPFTSSIFGVPKTPNGVMDFGIKMTQGGSQRIAASAVGAAGSPGIPGNVGVGLGLPIHIGMGVNQSMFRLSRTIVAVPMSAGKAGVFANTFTAFGTVHHMTVDFHAWTPGSVRFSGLYYDKSVPCGGKNPWCWVKASRVSLPNITTAGSFNLTPLGGGSVTLVSPSKVSVDGAFSRRTATFSKLRLSFKGTQCSDGRDNDGDTLIDLDDPNCWGLLDNNEGYMGTGGCGIGPEVALLLLGLWWLRTRRRAPVA